MRGSWAVRPEGAAWRWGSRAGALCALALAMAGGAWAGEARSGFTVRVDLTRADTGTCSSTPGTPVTHSVVAINCNNTRPLEPVATPRLPPDGRAFRFVIPNGNGEQRYAGVDLYAGAGTITSWRVVHFTNWDYLEMTVGW